jgi:hypothetical protein
MKKILIAAVIILCCESCVTTKPLVDEELFKNELNSAIDDGFPEATYRVK